MRVFKNQRFNDWASKELLNDALLLEAALETAKGHYDAHLSAHLFKKRVALRGRGKRGGARTLIALKKDDKAFFIYGFAKNKKDNISDKELDVLKVLAKDLLGLGDNMIENLLKKGSLVEIKS